MKPVGLLLHGLHLGLAGLASSARLQGVLVGALVVQPFPRRAAASARTSLGALRAGGGSLAPAAPGLSLGGASVAVCDSSAMVHWTRGSGRGRGGAEVVRPVPRDACRTSGASRSTLLAAVLAGGGLAPAADRWDRGAAVAVSVLVADAGWGRSRGSGAVSGNPVPRDAGASVGTIGGSLEAHALIVVRGTPAAVAAGGSGAGTTAGPLSAVRARGSDSWCDTALGRDPVPATGALAVDRACAGTLRATRSGGAPATVV